MFAETSCEGAAVEVVEPHPIPRAADEAELIAQAKSESAVAIQQLVGRYERRLLRLTRKITGNHEDAEEAVQNAFVRAFQNLTGFRGESRFSTWLVRIAMNEALMKVRRRRPQHVPIDDSSYDDHALVRPQLEDQSPNPEESYSRGELQTILASAVNDLDPGYRAVFQLREVEGFTTDETARVLGLSLSAVKSRLQRARLRLRDSLDSYFGTRKDSAAYARSSFFHGQTASANTQFRAFSHV